MPDPTGLIRCLDRQRQGDGTFFFRQRNHFPLIAKFSAAHPVHMQRRRTHGNRLSPNFADAHLCEFSRRVCSINSVVGSNAAKTRQAKSGLIPVRCVSRLQSIEQKIQLPASEPIRRNRRGGDSHDVGRLELLLLLISEQQEGGRESPS